MGNHIWTLGSKPRKHNCQAKDTSEEEEEEEAPHNLHHTIPRPNGEAGWGGDSGRGFNIQNLIGLSEDKAQYNAITVSLCPSMIHFPDLILGGCLECYACSLQAQRSTSLAFTGPRYISDDVGGITTCILKSSNFANLYLKNMNKTHTSGLTSEGRGFTLNSNKTNYSNHLCGDNTIYLKAIH